MNRRSFLTRIMAMGAVLALPAIKSMPAPALRCDAAMAEAEMAKTGTLIGRELTIRRPIQMGRNQRLSHCIVTCRLDAELPAVLIQPGCEITNNFFKYAK